MYPEHKCSSETLLLLFVCDIKGLQLKSFHSHYPTCALSMTFPYSVLPNTRASMTGVQSFVNKKDPVPVMFPITPHHQLVRVWLL